MTPTLNQRLDAKGYTTEPAGVQYKKKILLLGTVVFEGTAHDVTEWLNMLETELVCDRGDYKSGWTDAFAAVRYELEARHAAASRHNA